MANKMLIDASHPEETRVVVVRGSRIEEFDFESEHKKQLKGNIYLAKVTRVEPSLQAAFVEYGGNRHGFLAFNEIHPDYYQIPKADRQALIEEDLARAEEEEIAEDAKVARSQQNKRPPRSRAAERDDSDGDSVSEEVEEAGNASETGHSGEDHRDGEDHEPGSSDAEENGGEEASGSNEADTESGDLGGEREQRNRRRGRGRRNRSRNGDDDHADENGEEEEIDEVGSEDAMEEVPVRQVRPRRQYKIQEVIKRRQILLVQVVKEERGNKGAALTTYLSLAGRYSVLMPNTARGGGISRKITNAVDRKRLKDVVRELEVPRGMGIILRTAGANRTKAEVKRDYEYLMRLWETVRNVTLSSIAPALVYEEGSLIKRSIRDLYNKDIDQILVAGEGGYREAKDFMRMLMPSQAKAVQPYRDPTPIFARQGIEGQLDRMLQPHVTLKSGGYIIINQTEALVAIDVNSGRSTKEHSIEDTAYQTNLEAAEEVARQLRLRDLAGLIVIDFIDMEEKRNNRAVEKKMKDCLKSDRARIQVGRISHFGLMEMSRQRIRASVLESTMQTCPVCEGTGHIRSASSLALHVLRTIEEHLQKHSSHDLIVKVPTATALYVLNEKRKRIEELERLYGLRIMIEADESAGRQGIQIDHGAEAPRAPMPMEAIRSDAVAAIDAAEEAADEEAARAAAVDIAASDEPGAEGEIEQSADSAESGRPRRRRRRGRRRDGDKTETAAASSDDNGDSFAEDDETEADSGEPHHAVSSDDDERGRRRRRRGRRGGRRNRDDLPENGEEGESETPLAATGFVADAAEDRANADQFFPEASVAVERQAEPAHALAAEAAPAAATQEVDEAHAEIAAEPVVEDDRADAPIASPSGEHDGDATAANDDLPAVEAAPTSTPKEPVVTSGNTAEPGQEEEKPRRTGWWARRSFF
ncbi:Rne/Rng family ribonuclease [Aurantimonas endophytica]|uniref:Ribonuclease E n=1 Tax=Aurantimonas endophytica TaxID=1522175 RepID=A0A7W6HAN6_9HYPH|nr:ribonuclease E/G [Aurantimonas endophytica]MBB4001658.1 ribonuclease E [Aurantimonas endophytica]MCO6402705.1 Rne/Rng family ribonuclease [Aurantimonas endophytica]